MKMKWQWQDLFQSHILDRGLDYYITGLVGGVAKDVDFIKASVQGSKTYEVFIDIKKGNIIDMNCDCPYAAEGNHCKHMASVLYHIDSNEESQADGVANVLDSTQESVKKLIDEADDALVRNFLTAILEDDKRTLNNFKIALGFEISPLDVKRYKREINDIFRNYAGRQGFIDYYNAHSFISELLTILDNDIWSLIKNSKFKEAFELTNYIFIKTGNQDMDDSDGGIGILAENCLEIWQEIIEHCDMELKKKAFQWFIQHLEGSVSDYMEDYVEQILFEYFKENEFLEYKLKFTEDKVCELKKKKDHWTWSYHGGKWALLHKDIMKELKNDQNSIDEYCKKNLEFSKVRQYYVGKCLKRGEYETAIHVLEEGKYVDKDFYGLVADYSLQLKNLYKQLKRYQDYEKELWSLILKYKTGELSIYKELKLLYTEEEWKEKREIIFKNLLAYSRIDELYKEEKLYDRLLKNVLDSRGIYKLKEYESSLKDLYPNELLDKYETVVKSMASQTSDRKQYNEIVSILRRMQKYPNGKEKVKKIVLEWQYRYKNRRAMMDELSRL